MTAKVAIIADASGLFGADGMEVVVASDAQPGIYEVTLGVTVDPGLPEARHYSTTETFRVRAPMFFKNDDGDIRPARYTRDSGTDAIALRT